MRLGPAAGAASCTHAAAISPQLRTPPRIRAARIGSQYNTGPAQTCVRHRSGCPIAELKQRFSCNRSCFRTLTCRRYRYSSSLPNVLLARMSSTYLYSFSDSRGTDIRFYKISLNEIMPNAFDSDKKTFSPNQFSDSKNFREKNTSAREAC